MILMLEALVRAATPVVMKGGITSNVVKSACVPLSARVMVGARATPDARLLGCGDNVGVTSKENADALPVKDPRMFN